MKFNTIYIRPRRDFFTGLTGNKKLHELAITIIEAEVPTIFES